MAEAEGEQESPSTIPVPWASSQHGLCWPMSQAHLGCCRGTLCLSRGTGSGCNAAAAEGLWSLCMTQLPRHSHSLHAKGGDAAGRASPACPFQSLQRQFLCWSEASVAGGAVLGRGVSLFNSLGAAECHSSCGQTSSRAISKYWPCSKNQRGIGLLRSEVKRA